MRRFMSPRLRAPVVFALAAVVAVVIGGADHGWASVGFVAPVLVVVFVALFVLAGRDSDPGAVIRRQVDERQANQRLKVQALVGRVLSLAVAVAYIIAMATKAMLWPWAILIGLVGGTFLIGWLLHGEHGDNAGANDEFGRREE